MKRNLFLSVLFVLMFAPAHAQQVNILSYNVHNCIGMDKEYNYRRIANVISQTSPDIVALQELDSVTVRNKGIHALGELEKLTGMHGTYAAAIPFQGGSYGTRNPLQRDTHKIQNHSNARTGRKTYPHYCRI